MKCANASGLKGLTVVVGEVEGVVGEAEVGLETTTDQKIERGIMAGAIEEVPSVLLLLLLTSIVLTFFVPPASTISLSSAFSLASVTWQDTFQRPLFSFPRPSSSLSFSQSNSCTFNHSSPSITLTEKPVFFPTTTSPPPPLAIVLAT